MNLPSKKNDTIPTKKYEKLVQSIVIEKQGWTYGYTGLGRRKYGWQKDHYLYFGYLKKGNVICYFRLTPPLKTQYLISGKFIQLSPGALTSLLEDYAREDSLPLYSKLEQLEIKKQSSQSQSI